MVEGMRTTDFLTHEGDPLVVSHSIHEFLGRYEAIQRLTGLPPSMFITSFMASIPLPAYFKVDKGETRWAGMNAEAITCPIFWIPTRVSNRYPVFSPEGERPETDDEWALRIAIHLVMAGLYNPDTGLWRDVPEALGYDLEDDSVRDRFQSWLDGAADEELDALDASPMFDMPEIDGDPDVYAWQAAQNSLPGLRAIAADDHYREVLADIAVAGELVEERELTFAQVRDHVALTVTHAQLATAHLGDAAVAEVLSEAEANVDVCDSADQLFGFAVAEMVEVMIELQQENLPLAEQTTREAQEFLEAVARAAAEERGPVDEQGRKELRSV